MKPSFNLNLLLKNIPFLLLCCVVSANAQWETQESGVNTNLYNVWFVDSLSGWAIGDSSTIISTTNGGTSWVRQVAPDSLGNLVKIQFVSGRDGFIIGKDGLFLATSDGGTNWLNKSEGFNYDLSDICFLNKNTGYVCGSYFEDNAQILYSVILNTKDGGSNWDTVLQRISYSQFGSIRFKAVQFINNVGWALGGDYADNFSDTYVYKTYNGGKDWEAIDTLTFLYLLDVISEDTLWASGIPLYRSFDGGSNWWIYNSESYSVLPIDMSFANGKRGWVVHYNNLTKENIVLYTSNSGESWEEDYVPDGFTIRAITNVMGRYVWAVGSNGTILKKHIVTDIENYEKNFPGEFKLNQNYPNPFNPNTIISWQSPVYSHTTLKIFNVLGKEVATLLNEERSAGKYIIEFDASKYELSSGIYLYTLRTERKSLSNKMIYLK